MRKRIADARRRLRASGATRITAFGFYPDLETPAVLYELAGPAQAYVESHMLPGGGGPIWDFVLRVAAACIGCDLRVSVVVVAGTQS